MNGFIYKGSVRIIYLIKFFNPVEIFKKIYAKNADFRTEAGKKKFNEAIDLFIIIKYFFILILWKFSYQNSILFGLVIYLLIMNIFTYFYYHLWNNRNTGDIERDRRRFINLILSILYSNLSFGYLYRFYYLDSFSGWQENISKSLQALSISFIGTFGGNYTNITPITNEGVIISIFNSIINFLFIAIILSNTGIRKSD